ncbi:MAG: 2-oxoisovalerate dehydrogenase [Candidatus Firestonebacteria bacterium]
MEKEIIFLIEESLDGGYEAKAMGYSVFTEAETLEELKEAIKDAVKCHFEEKDVPHIIRLHFVKDEVMVA